MLELNLLPCFLRFLHKTTNLWVNGHKLTKISYRGVWFQHKMAWRCDISGLKDVPFLKSKAGLFFLCLYYAFTTNLANIQMQTFFPRIQYSLSGSIKGRHGGIWPPVGSSAPCLPSPPSEGKNGQNQPFSADFSPSEMHFAPLMPHKKFLVPPLYSLTWVDLWATGLVNLISEPFHLIFV